MKIDSEKLKKLREETQAQLEMLVYLEYQIDSGKVSDDSIAFPNHMTDKTLFDVIPKVADTEISRILPLPILSQKLVIF